MLDSHFWSGRKVLITGHTGFKGGWLAHWLSALGADVTGFALPPEESPSLYEIAGVGSLLDSHYCDVADTKKVLAIVRKCQPEIVIHMAAQPLVRHSYVQPVETYRTNVMGTVNLLDAVRLTGGCRAMVNVTTDKCYENNEWEWGYRENDRLGGHDPYSNSKACSELVTAAYRQSYFHADDYDKHHCAIGTARAGNVIGGGDWSGDRLLPDIIRAFEQNLPVEIRNPNATRPWQHVLEPLSGYLLLAQKLATSGMEYADGWNFGPEDASNRNVGWIAEQAARMWAGDAKTVFANESNAPHEARFLKLDCSKARSFLGWQSVWSIDESLQRVIDWHQAYRSGSDMTAVIANEINAYQHAAKAVQA